MLMKNMSITGSSINNDDVSASFDEEPVGLRSPPQRSQPNLTAGHRKLKSKPRPQPQSVVVEYVFQILRFVSGVTISTASTLLRPPLHMTQSFVLPELGYAISNYYDDITPERVKLWLQILPSFLAQTIQVLSQTEQGSVLGNKFSTLAASGLETLSTAEMMRVLLSSAALWIKVVHALQTPQVHEVIEHNTDLACQWLDALSSPSMKKFIRDIRELFWASILLAADDQTTVALARVIATLCHALESEQLDTFTGERYGNELNLNSKKMSDEWSPLEVAPGPTTATDASSCGVAQTRVPPAMHKHGSSLPTVIHRNDNTEETGAPEVESAAASVSANTVSDCNNLHSASNATHLFMQVFEETINNKRSVTLSSILEKQEDGDSCFQENSASRGNQQSDHSEWDDMEQEDLDVCYTQWWLPEKHAMGVAVLPSLNKSDDRRHAKKSRRAAKVDVVHERVIAIVGCSIFIFLLVSGILFFLGIYGLYKLFAIEGQPPLQPEVVVRVIREVIYVSSDGQVLNQKFLCENNEIE